MNLPSVSPWPTICVADHRDVVGYCKGGHRAGVAKPQRIDTRPAAVDAFGKQTAQVDLRQIIHSPPTAHFWACRHASVKLTWRWHRSCYAPGEVPGYASIHVSIILLADENQDRHPDPGDLRRAVLTIAGCTLASTLARQASRVYDRDCVLAVTSRARTFPRWPSSLPAISRKSESDAKAARSHAAGKSRRATGEVCRC